MSYRHLTLEERKKLARMWKAKASIREIGRALGRSASTVSREINRNIRRGNRHVLYRPVNAQKKYQARECAGRAGKYADMRLVSYVQEKLLETWSPEQVAGRLPLDYPETPGMRVSHSTIYHWLHQGKLGQAAPCLRHTGHRHGEHRGISLGIRTLRQRGKEVWRRERVGDWEIDTIVSSGRASHAGLLTMCDRKSRYCIAILLGRCHSNKHVFQALAKIVTSYPCRSFSTGQGTEFGCYPRIESELGLPVYFCSPGSPWQKGSVENMNGLLRQFFPKGTNFIDISHEQVSNAMLILNNRPRKALHWHSPAELLRSVLL